MLQVLPWLLRDSASFGWGDSGADEDRCERLEDEKNRQKLDKCFFVKSLLLALHILFLVSDLIERCTVDDSYIWTTVFNLMDVCSPSVYVLGEGEEAWNSLQLCRTAHI